MNTHARKLAPFILLVLSLTLYAANPTKTTMTDEELRAAITLLHRPALLKAWAVYGDETWNYRQSCVTHRDIYIFSTPKHINSELVRSDVIELSFEAEQKPQSGCGRLLQRNEQHLTAAKFIGSSKNHSSTAALAKTFFKIHGEMNDNQLVELGGVIAKTRECILHKNECEKLNLTIYLPSSLANRLNSVSAENIASVLILPSPNNAGPYLISFKPYPAHDLLMDVYWLGTKKPLVGISYVIP